MKKLIEVQQLLKAPKSQRNNFGKYNYRSCEDIIEAAKPLLTERGLLLTISDEISQIGDRYYVKATASVTDGDQSVTTVAYAREEEAKKGMDGAQITGSASSYARKYALNGLFAIDDTKDADATNTHGKKAEKQADQQVNKPLTQKQIFDLKALITEKGRTDQQILDRFKINSFSQMTQEQYVKAVKGLSKL